MLATAAPVDPYAPPFPNNETVNLPQWAKEELRELNSQLRAILAPADYLEILKGEAQLINDNIYEYDLVTFQNEELDPSLKDISKLKAKLEHILQNPDDEIVFARPHFLHPKQDGVFFREDLRYANADLYWEDDLYVVGRSDNLIHFTSATCDFWNSRTCKKDASFAIPTTYYLHGGGDGAPLIRLQGTPAYYARAPHWRESHSKNWAGCKNVDFIILPQDLIFSSAYKEPFSFDPENRVGDLWNKYGSSEEAEKSTAALAEIGLKVPEATDLDACPPWIFSTDDTSLYCKATHKRTWRLDLENLKFTFGANIATQSKDTEIKSNIDKAVSSYSGYYHVHSLGYLRMPWETSNHTDYCDGVAAFTVKDGRGYALGIYSPGQGVKLFPQLKGLAPDHVARQMLPPHQVGSTIMEFPNVDSGALEKHPVIDETVIQKSSKIPTLQITQQEDGKIYIFASAVMLSGGTESWLFEMSADGSQFYVRHHHQFRNSRLNALFMPKMQYIFLPNGENSYLVKKLLPDGNEEDVGELFVNAYQGYALVLPDGRYAGSPGCEAFLGLGDGNQSVGMEALAPWRNRPAEVLDVLGGSNDDIAALRQTTRRWLTKQGFNPDAMPKEPTLDDFAHVNVTLPPLHTETTRLELDVELIPAARRAVSALEVRVNGVKIPQSWDADLLVPAGQRRNLTVQVPLGTGQNWIELKPIDTMGVTGSISDFRTICKGEYQPELYVVALGVSDYADDSLDLQYAAKDAQDMSAAFEQYSPYRVRKLTLTNEQVTPEALKLVSGFLSGATVNDTVVLYVAGHGMLDENLAYYYAPVNFNSEQVRETGISMEDLRSCLKSTAARKRLLLLDTCHSGAMGEADIEKLALSGITLPPGVRAIQNRGMKVQKAASALSNEAQTRRYVEEMFSSAAAEDGISVLAASAGAEFAMESDEWQNGIFTTVLLKALKTPVSVDLNKDFKVSLEELLIHVLSQVSEMSGGLQIPSMQMEESVRFDAIWDAPASAPEAMEKWVDFFKTESPNNSLSYMYETYEDTVTFLKTGKTINLQDLISQQYNYIGRWVDRKFDVVDYKITGNIIEIRSRYTCTNTKGKTVRGYSKTTYRISENGRIEGIADDSSSKTMPNFSAAD